MTRREKPPKREPAPRHEWLYLMARCEACCAATATPHTILARALTGNAAFFSRMLERQVSTESLARCVASLDVLEHLNEIAGPLVRPWRSRGRDKAAVAAKEALRARVETLAAAIGVRPPLIAIAVTHDSTLLYANSGVSDAQFLTYHERLNRIAAAFAHQTGEAHGEREESEAGQAAE